VDHRCPDHGHGHGHDHRVRPRRAELVLARPGAGHGRQARSGRKGAEGTQPRVGAEAKARGDTRVVCRRGSLKRAIKSIDNARKNGWVLRPSQGTRKLSARNARRLKRQNRAFAKRCKFKSIQAAIKRSHNNDRVIVMPGK
jgi:hypothetical protein